jgi:trans-2,3-dihydro-3-hydroxyanthranilic acid synthase
MAIPHISPYPLPRWNELPANTARWEIDPRRAMLLVHDMQKYFLDAFPAGQPPVTELVENVTRLRTRCAEVGVPVGYTAQPGGMTEAQRGLLRDFWGPGMTTGPEQRGIAEGLAPVAGDHVFTKWRYSAFHRSGLLEHMRETGRDQLVLCGVYAHVGVLMTAVEAFTNDIETFLIADGIADFTPEYHRLALRYAAERCSVVLPAAAALAALDAPTREHRAAS